MLAKYNPPVGDAFHFEHSLQFTPERAAEILRGVPSLPGVFALRGADENAQPYLTRTANLQRRMARLLAPLDAVDAEGRPLVSKRLNLSARVARIEYTVTGSEFESVLVLYRASAAVFGAEEARRRLRLHTPFFLRFAAENAFPRIYTTNKLSKRSLAHMYGPFASRAAADRYCEAVEDLFLIRRCHEELRPTPEHPGCIYGEMGKCLAPCNRAQVPANAAAYSAEAAAVEAFLNTRGESLLTKLTVERERASADLDFERAAELHAQVHKVKAAIALADELVVPVPKLRAVIVQKAAKGEAAEAEEPMAALFLLEGGCIFGPARMSTLGVRAVREQTAVGSSLFAQPLMIEAVPLAEEGAGVTPGPTPSESPEGRAQAAIAALQGLAVPGAKAPAHVRAGESAWAEAQAYPMKSGGVAESKSKRSDDLATLSDHLSLLRRWYYRPEKQRVGEVFFPREDGSWPARRILRAAARAALGEPALLPEVRRDLAQKNSSPTDTLPPATST